MKLLCTLCVINRSAANLAVSQKNKHLKSTLALCKHPKTNEYCFLLFSTNNKTGTRYLIKDNILKVLTRFMNEGKATIQFKNPAHDFAVQADVVQLKSFMVLLKKVLDNTIAPKDLTVSSLDVKQISEKASMRKLVIKSRSDYPLRGLPRMLETLHINGIKRCGFDRGILNLVKLRVLDLSDNLIESLPLEASQLNLSELNLKGNLLGRVSPKKWDWLTGNLALKLRLLDLTNNDMHFMPDQIIRLHGLVTLRLDNNRLKFFSSGIGKLGHLRILSASKNILRFLPGSIRNLKLDEIDLFDNNFDRGPFNNSQPEKNLAMNSLKDLAARQVLTANLHYDSETLPYTVVKYMELAKYCFCGKACFEISLPFRTYLHLPMIACTVSSSDGASAVPMESQCCSVQCYLSYGVRNRPSFI